MTIFLQQQELIVAGFPVLVDHRMGHMQISHDGAITWDQLQAIKVEVWGADARAIEATIRRDLLAPFVRLNWGPTVPAPQLHLQVDAQLSRKDAMELAKSAWAMGWPVDMVALA